MSQPFQYDLFNQDVVFTLTTVQESFKEITTSTYERVGEFDEFVLVKVHSVPKRRPEIYSPLTEPWGW